MHRLEVVAVLVITLFFSFFGVLPARAMDSEFGRCAIRVAKEFGPEYLQENPHEHVAALLEIARLGFKELSEPEQAGLLNTLITESDRFLTIAEPPDYEAGYVAASYFESLRQLCTHYHLSAQHVDDAQTLIAARFAAIPHFGTFSRIATTLLKPWTRDSSWLAWTVGRFRRNEAPGAARLAVRKKILRFASERYWLEIQAEFIRRVLDTRDLTPLAFVELAQAAIFEMDRKWGTKEALAQESAQQYLAFRNLKLIRRLAERFQFRQSEIQLLIESMSGFAAAKFTPYLPPGAHDWHWNPRNSDLARETGGLVSELKLLATLAQDAAE